MIAVSIGLSVRRSKPNQIMLWPSNRNKGDDPDGNNSDLKFNSLIHHADHSELFFHSSFFRNCQKSKIEILSYRKGGFRQEWIKVGWKAYGSYVKLIKIDPFNYVFGCVQVKYYLRVDHLDTNFVYHIKFTQNCNCDKKHITDLIKTGITALPGTAQLGTEIQILKTLPKWNDEIAWCSSTCSIHKKCTRK